MSEFSMFIPLTKVDEEKRLVYGIATAEEADRSGEICDYATTKPHYEKWSSDMAKASGGKSLGNVRAMHGKSAAGKLVKLFCNDEAKQIEVCAKIVDDNDWNKVLEGVYTGFSHGGAYVRKWKDPDDPSKMRYTGRPSELSLVDVPCLNRTFFQIQKMDGTVVDKDFQMSEEALEQDVEDMLMLVSVGTALGKFDDPSRWDECLEDAERGILETFVKYSDDQPRDSSGKWASAAIGAALGGAKGAVLGALTAGTPGAVVGGISGAISGAAETSSNAYVRASGEILSAVTSAVGVGAIASRMMNARKTMDAAVSGVKAVVGAAETGQSASEAVKNLTDPTARGHAEQFIDKARDEAMRQFESAQSDIEKARTKAQKDFDAAVKRQAAKMKSDKAAAEARSKLKTVRGSKKDEAEKAVETGDMKKMTITNEQVFEKAKELATAAGDVKKYGDYIGAARTELEKILETKDYLQKVAEEKKAELEKKADEKKVEDESKLEKKADEKKPTEDWGVKQVWMAKDGSTHEKKADALAKNAEVEASQDPLMAKLDAVLGAKADDKTSDELEKISPIVDELKKYLGEEAWDSQRAIEAMNNIFGLLAKEMSESEKDAGQIASLQKAIDGLKAFVVSEIQEDNSDPMARISKMAEEMGTMAKAGARNSKADLEMLKVIHDHACALGAECSPVSKSEEIEDLAKRATAYDALAPKIDQVLEKISAQDETIKNQAEEILRLRKMAAPPPTLHVVDKQGGIAIANSGADTKGVEEEFNKLSQEDKALLMVKLAQQQPKSMGLNG